MREERIAGHPTLPQTAVLEMTYQCNHCCIFCSCPWFAPGSRYPVDPEMSVEDWKAVIAELCRLGINRIAFTGGEPLLKPGIREIIRHASACTAALRESTNEGATGVSGPPRLYLLSNGRAMTDDTLEFCREHRVKLSFSLPGLATFREHTGVDNAAGVLGWFSKARARGMSATVGVTVTQKNLPELFETLSTAFIAGADTLLMNRFMPGGRGLAWSDELFLDTGQMKTMMDTAEEVLKLSRRPGGLGTEIPRCIFDPARYSSLRVSSTCAAAREFFIIDPAGYLRVCNHSEVRLTHFREIESINEHPYWRAFLRREYQPSMCSNCDSSGECAGGCREAAHIVAKSVRAPDPIFKNEERAWATSSS